MNIDDCVYGVILDFINDAISPEFQITSKGIEAEALKPYSWWDISAVDIDSIWTPALISFRKGSGELIVAAGYSSQSRSVISIADPNASKKILDAVRFGWDECPDHDFYKR